MLHLLSRAFNLHRGKPSIPTIHSYGINLMTRYTTLAHHLAIYIVFSEFEPYFPRTYLPSFLFWFVSSPQFLLANISSYFSSCLLWFMYLPFESASHILSLIEPAHSVEVFRIWAIVLRLRLQAHPLTLSTCWNHLKWIWQKLNLRNTWTVKAAKIFLITRPSFRSFYTSHLVLRAARTLFRSPVPTSVGVYSSVLLFIMVAARGRAHLVFTLFTLFCMLLKAALLEACADVLKKLHNVASHDDYISHVLNCWAGSRRPTTGDIAYFKLRLWLAAHKEPSVRSASETAMLEIAGCVLVASPLLTLTQFWDDETNEASIPDYSSHDNLIIQKHTAAEAFGVVGIATLMEQFFDGTLSLDDLGWFFWWTVCATLSADRGQLGFKRKAQWASRVSLTTLTESRLKNLSLGIRCIGPRSSWYHGFVHRTVENYSPIHERVEAAVDVFLGFKYGVAISYRHERTLVESCALLESLLMDPPPRVQLNRIVIDNRTPQNIEVVWADVFLKAVKEVEDIRSPWVSIGLEPYMYFDVLRQREIPDGEKRLWLALECRLVRSSFPRIHLSHTAVFFSLYASGRYLFLKAFDKNDVRQVARIGYQLYQKNGWHTIGAEVVYMNEDIFGGDVSIQSNGSRAVIYASSEEIEHAKQAADDLIGYGVYQRCSAYSSDNSGWFRPREAAFIYIGEEEEESEIVVLGRLTRVEYRRRHESIGEMNQSYMDEPRFLLTSRPGPQPVFSM